MTCVQCHRYYTRDLGQEQPPCSQCPKPVLDDANTEVWEIYMMWMGQLRAAGLGVGGHDLNVLPFLFMSFGVPRFMWRTYTEKLLTISAVHTEFMNKKSEER